jgi:hypothetical protein
MVPDQLEEFQIVGPQHSATAFSLAKVIGVYTITCKRNGRVYAGSSGDCYQRICWHLVKLRIGGHINRELQADFSEYGEEAFEHRIVERHSIISDAKNAECKYVAKLRQEGRPYNVVFAGKYRPRKASHEYKALLRSSINIDKAACLQQWMADNDKNVFDLIEALKIEKMRAYRLVAGTMPHDYEMRAIFAWTNGEIDANEIYGLNTVPYAVRRKARAA